MKKQFIPFTDFMKLDIRVGEVKTAVQAEGSNKLILLTVDLGEDYGVVEIFTGMAKFHTLDEFIGKKFLFIANLEPRPMMGKTSNGMIISADVDEKPVLLPADQSIPNGASIS